MLIRPRFLRGFIRERTMKWINRNGSWLFWVIVVAAGTRMLGLW